MSLQSLCRLAVRKSVGVFRLWRMSEIDLSPQITDYLLFREIFLSINQVVDQRDYDVIPKLNEVIVISGQALIEGPFFSPMTYVIWKLIFAS